MPIHKYLENRKFRSTSLMMRAKDGLIVQCLCMTKAMVEILLKHGADNEAKLDHGTDIQSVSRAGFTAPHLCKT